MPPTYLEAKKESGQPVEEKMVGLPEGLRSAVSSAWLLGRVTVRVRVRVRVRGRSGGRLEDGDDQLRRSVGQFAR